MAKAPLAYLYQVVLAKVWQKQRCWDHSWSWLPGFMSSGKDEAIQKMAKQQEMRGVLGLSKRQKSLL